MLVTLDLLPSPVSTLPMVGPAASSRLEELGIHTLEDLLHHYPFRYDDLSHISSIAQLTVGETVTLTGEMLSITNTYLRSGKTLQKGIFSDGSATIPVNWFNQPYLVKNFQTRPAVSLSGKVIDYHGHLTLQSPQYESSMPTTMSRPLSSTHTGRLVPIYHETAGISSKWLRSRIKPLLDQLDPGIDWLPESIRLDNRLISLPEALREIHFPTHQAGLDRARERLSFDELFLYQLAAQIRKHRWAAKTVSFQLHIDAAALARFVQSLPFTLTPGQQRALTDILTDLHQPVAMNRLLQGDVGAGKTVVAAAAIYMTFLNHLPSVVMAPTEVLALQHFDTLTKLLEPLGVKIGLFTHSRTLSPTNPDVYLGTHALLFRELPVKVGLVVIDEQHRFGVAQRAQLLQGATIPNVLSMTATPIPRTVALTLYAELDISVIDELPVGRQPVTTWLVPAPKRPGAYTWIAKELATHHAQAFVVCPLITDSPAPMLDQVKAAETEFIHLRDRVFPQFRVGLIHGRLKAKDKQAVIQAFKAKEIDILVATPVIEVGIDIPSATIMVIEASERFGLAELHQLRGRVGRGSAKSYCLLFTTGNQGTARLKHLTTIHSGHTLAELDLKLRGPGDLYGVAQSGYLDLKIASLSDSPLVTKTYQQAAALVTIDPDLHTYPRLNDRLLSLLAKQSVAN